MLKIGGVRFEHEWSKNDYEDFLQASSACPRQNELFNFSCFGVLEFIFKLIYTFFDAVQKY